MDVILLERVERLGQIGDVVKVKNGFARNFLLPRKKALRATKENRALFEARRVQLEADNLKLRGEAEAMAKRMEGLTVSLLRQASDKGQLYGSVSARDIAEAVTKAGYTVGRDQVALDKAIKDLGIHAVRVALHAEVKIAVKVNVARSEAEAELQLTDPAKLAASAEAFFEKPRLPEVEQGQAEARAEAEGAAAAPAEDAPAKRPR
ncbi:MAG: 50S ribosomal protein L9, partial [Alphaproteobacteria bacterium]|nr:50S ribosomal protein L9 [Alphaproteobacteria bacterium]